MTIVLYSLFLLLALLVETSVVKIPTTMVFLLILYITFKTQKILVLAFLMGILLDLLNIKPIGTSSLLFIIFLLFVSLYEKKYQIHTLPFVALSSFICALIYNFVVYQPNSNWTVTLLATFTGVLFFLFSSKIDSTTSL